MKKDNYFIKPLGEVIKLKRGYDLPGKDRETGPYPVFSSTNIVGYHNEYKIDDECVITGRSGTIGEVRYYQGKCWPLNTSLYVEDFKGNVPKYVYYLLKSINFDNFSSGTSVPTLNRNHIHKMNCLVANVETQKKIVDFIKPIERKMEINNKIIKANEEFSSLLFNYWFLQFDFPNEEGKPYKSSGGKMKFSKETNSNIPEDWDVINLGDYLNFDKGFEPGSSEYSTIKKNYVPFYRVGDIDKGVTDIYINQELSKIRVKENEVLLSLDGSPGKVAYGIEGCYSTGLRKVYDKRNIISTGLVYQILNSEFIQKTISQHSTGSNILHASNALNHMYVPFNAEKYKVLGKTYEEIFEFKVTLKRENKELTDLKNFLLPLLMNGQATIKD